MEDSQRQSMYDGWARKQKFVNILVEPHGDQFRAVVKRTDESQPAIEIYRDTRQQAIYSICGAIGNAGFEVGNLPEIYGISARMIRSDIIPEGRSTKKTVNTGPVKEMARQELETEIEELRAELQKYYDNEGQIKR